MAKQQSCPHCGEECWRDEVDIGVGIIYGPWGCPGCGWSSDPAYDHHDNTACPKQLEYPGWYVDQGGGMQRKSAMKERLEHFGLDSSVIDDLFFPDPPEKPV